MQSAAPKAPCALALLGCALVIACVLLSSPGLGRAGHAPLAGAQELAARARGHRGAIQIFLAWNSTDDLDLHVITPDGGEINVYQKKHQGGRLDLDYNAGCDNITRTLTPVEHVYWPSSPPPPNGTYRAYLVVYKRCTATPVSWHGSVKVSGVMVISQRGVLGPSCSVGGTRQIADFVYPLPASDSRARRASTPSAALTLTHSVVTAGQAAFTTSMLQAAQGHASAAGNYVNNPVGGGGSAGVHLVPGSVPESGSVNKQQVFKVKPGTLPSMAGSYNVFRPGDGPDEKQRLAVLSIREDVSWEVYFKRKLVCGTLQLPYQGEHKLVLEDTTKRLSWLSFAKQVVRCACKFGKLRLTDDASWQDYLAKLLPSWCEGPLQQASFTPLETPTRTTEQGEARTNEQGQRKFWEIATEWITQDFSIRTLDPVRIDWTVGAKADLRRDTRDLTILTLTSPVAALRKLKSGSRPASPDEIWLCDRSFELRRQQGQSWKWALKALAPVVMFALGMWEICSARSGLLPGVLSMATCAYVLLQYQFPEKLRADLWFPSWCFAGCKCSGEKDWRSKLCSKTGNLFMTSGVLFVLAAIRTWSSGFRSATGYVAGSLAYLAMAVISLKAVLLGRFIIFRGYIISFRHFEITVGIVISLGILVAIVYILHHGAVHGDAVLVSTVVNWATLRVGAMLKDKIGSSVWDWQNDLQQAAYTLAHPAVEVDINEDQVPDNNQEEEVGGLTVRRGGSGSLREPLLPTRA